MVRAGRASRGVEVGNVLGRHVVVYPRRLPDRDLARHEPAQAGRAVADADIRAEEADTRGAVMPTSELRIGDWVYRIERGADAIEDRAQKEGSMTDTTEPKHSFCWRCGKALMRATCGANKGKLVFTEVTVHGETHIVHKRCKIWNDFVVESMAAKQDVARALK